MSGPGFGEAPLASKPSSDGAGHRKRLQDRYDAAGASALSAHELLEMFLFEFIPRADTKAPAKALLKRFSNLEGVLHAPAEELQTVSGIGPKAARSISVLASIHRRSLQERVLKREVLSSWSSVMEYLRAEMAFLYREQFRVLFLNKRNALIADEVLHEGTVDHTPAYPREVIRRSIELSATALVLVHNHPSGDPTPSRADLEMTQQIIDAGKPLMITVHDHVIIGRNEHASMRGLHLI